jgi:hypothetical protein
MVYCESLGSAIRSLNDICIVNKKINILIPINKIMLSKVDELRSLHKGVVMTNTSSQTFVGEKSSEMPATKFVYICDFICVFFRFYTLVTCDSSHTINYFLLNCIFLQGFVFMNMIFFPKDTTHFYGSFNFSKFLIKNNQKNLYSSTSM